MKNMKKVLSIVAFLLVTATISNGQTTATDFTGVDCLGGSHNLFTDLDNGKVIVLVWVMPCSGCVNGAKAADSARQSLAASIPAGVFMYLICDGPPNDCTTLQSWASTNHLGHPAMFGNASNEIDQSNYGGLGMPHIVVVGPNHTIYFNQKDSTGVGVYSAVQNAINVATNVHNVSENLKFSIAPNPALQQIFINCEIPIESIFITSMTGEIVKTVSFDKGKLNPVIVLSGMAKGVYAIRITDIGGNSAMQIMTKQ